MMIERKYETDKPVLCELYVYVYLIAVVVLV